VAARGDFFGLLRASGAAAKRLPARWTHQVKRESRRFNELEPVPKKEIIFFKTCSGLKPRLSSSDFRFKIRVKRFMQRAMRWRLFLVAFFNSRIDLFCKRIRPPETVRHIRTISR
jgi:hypothetical protein